MIWGIFTTMSTLECASNSGIEATVQLQILRSTTTIKASTLMNFTCVVSKPSHNFTFSFSFTGKLIKSYFSSPLPLLVILLLIPSMKASSTELKQFLFLAYPFAQKPIQVHSICHAMPDQDEPKRPLYPLDSNSYRILDDIGVGASAVVYKAVCIPLNSAPVAIKSIDLDGSKGDLDDFRREAKTLSLLSHPNILNAHCSFTVDRRLWVVMPFMSAGSLQSIISSSYPDGLSEPCIAVILRETLHALAYLHDQGHLHRDIKAGNILMDSTGSVKLADFGVSASIFDFSSSHGWSSSSSSSSWMLTDVTGTPYWMAPEVFHSHNGYNFKADIWSFGITALELAHGRPPLSHLPLSKSLLMKITKQFRFSDYEQQKNEKKSRFSKAFKEMVASCLDQEPSRRPSAEKLLKHHFFKNSKGLDFLVKNLLQGLPSVEDRFRRAKLQRELSMKSEDEEGENEIDEERQIVKERRISGWNFNEDIFELDPVFPSEPPNGDSEVKPVHVAEDMKTEMRNEEVKHGGKGSGFIDRESMIKGLMVLKNSLDEQREKVVYLINLLRRGEEDGGGGEMKREEQMMQLIERLKTELDYERKKKVELAMEVEFLKLQL